MITVGIASVPERVDSLERTLDSLTGQVDSIVCVLNAHTELPSYKDKYNNVWFVLLRENKGDAMKFFSVVGCVDYYISWDDDLIAPEGVVKRLTDAVDQYNGVVGFHGKKYLAPVKDFRRWAGVYRCLGRVSEDVKVNLIGSGCTCFHTDRLKLSLDDFPIPNMADVWLSKACAEQGVPMMVLAHEVGYLKYVPPPKGTTIWDTTKDYSEHVKVMRTFIK